MAYDVLWSSRAKNDVVKIISFLEHDAYNPHAAREHLDAFCALFDALAETPELYAVSPTGPLNSRNYRKALVKNYVVIYSFDGNVVIIRRVFHARQNYAKYM